MDRSLLWGLNATHDRVLKVLEDVTEAEAGRQPAPGLAPIAWQAGHIAYYDAVMAHRCDGKTAAPAAFEGLFKMGTGGEPATYPSLPALREAFVAIHAALVDVATHRSPSDPVDSPRYTNVGEALAFTLYHRGYHVGKITTLRAMIRKPRLFG